MLDDRLRRLMRNISLGVPLALGLTGAAALSGCDSRSHGGDAGGPEDAGRIEIDAGGGGGGCMNVTQTYPLPSADAGAGPDGGLDAGTPTDPTCRDLCPDSSGGPGGGFGMLTDCDIGETDVDCHYQVCYTVGRRPDAPYRARAPRFDDPVIRHLVQVTIEEAASVPAFERLARALEAHGAPSSLARRARESAADEVRHAHIVAGLAERDVGEITVTIDVDDEPLPDLFELALHNVREGCVGEAYAALEAAWQAEHAPDAETRAVFAEIARDEAQHALLSLEIDAWARMGLERAQIETLDRERASRLARLLRDLAERPPMPTLGMPVGAQTTHLISMLA